MCQSTCLEQLSNRSCNKCMHIMVVVELILRAWLLIFDQEHKEKFEHAMHKKLVPESIQMAMLFPNR